MQHARAARNVRRAVGYVLVYLASASVFVLPLTMPILRSASDFSIYNTGWNGCSQLALELYRSGKKVYPIHTPFAAITQPEDPAGTALVIIGPTRAFTRGDAEYVAQFARLGGTVFIANDFDQGNSLLEHMDLELRFSGEPVVDLGFQKDPSIVECNVRSKGEGLTANLSSFLLNRPTAIVGKIPQNATIHATTSRMSWLDTDRDGGWDRTAERDERRGPFPVLASLPYGEGEILVLSDPSIFINSMITQTGNRQLHANLISYLTRARVERIYIDEEHHILANPIELFTVVVRREPDYLRLATVWVLVTAVLFVVHPRLRRVAMQVLDGLMAVSLWMLSLGARRGGAGQASDPVAQCIKEHLDWDEHTLRRIADRATRQQTTVEGLGEVAPESRTAEQNR